MACIAGVVDGVGRKEPITAHQTVNQYMSIHASGWRICLPYRRHSNLGSFGGRQVCSGTRVGAKHCARLKQCGSAH